MHRYLRNWLDIFKEEKLLINRYNLQENQDLEIFSFFQVVLIFMHNLHYYSPLSMANIAKIIIWIKIKLFLFIFKYCNVIYAFFKSERIFIKIIIIFDFIFYFFLKFITLPLIYKQNYIYIYRYIFIIIIIIYKIFW